MIKRVTKLALNFFPFVLNTLCANCECVLVCVYKKQPDHPSIKEQITK